MSAATHLTPVPTRPSAAIRPANSTRVGIGHALVDNCSFEQAEDAIIAHALAHAEPALVFTPNAQHIVLLSQNARLRDIYRNADLVLPDGVSLLLAARIFGREFPERIAGVDLFQSLCARAAAAGLKLFFLGGRPGSADAVADVFRSRHPGIQIPTYCPPLGFEIDPTELDGVASAIRAAQPHIVFVGLGAPKQELWIADHGRKLGPNVYVGVGGSFEMVAGIVKRAPRWIQALGCEWLHRLLVEPRRLWRRYLVGNPQFIAIVLKQRVRRAVLKALLHVLKTPSFEAELHDSALLAEAASILLRTSAIPPPAQQS